MEDTRLAGEAWAQVFSTVMATIENSASRSNCVLGPGLGLGREMEQDTQMGPTDTL